ncbi:MULTISPECIES: GDP-mannose 4,6-dehydratase [unclassified Lentimicrobium]|uniref:GDP-mannose 4,6-dehydratase n=1 Tax=unclassified Lentimicrobium TaxID=2677434 RepID=UPI00155790F5|nr:MULTISPECIES: GDP-mannose 4,6-dehydratase [unclassified Lentimicrobium]NPD45553.1 GDP-mannose 4,6-dehydratase [Lentimicrobium sp. S6]NPD83632.1 GDP-mannose 4,6-dehydratase [Lentimicrobium sp. L6]
MKKKAFITGVTGQDGAYLAQFLLEKGYDVAGGYRRLSNINFSRLDKLNITNDIKLVETDLQDTSNLVRVIQEEQPDEVYNLAAQSFVAHSFKNPILTGNVTGIGVTNILEAIRIINTDIKFYQASTSELFGNAKESPQNENTPFFPRSPYGVSKQYGHYATINYRESYDIFAVAGILFNHESPLRGLEFVTRKITNAVARIHLGKQDYFEIGNLDVKRDWGYAKEYVEAMWLMLQTEKPENYVLATGENHSVREWIIRCFELLGRKIVWQGEGENEVGKDANTGKILVKVNPEFYRPAEIYNLVGDYSKAKKELGWEPVVKYQKLVEIMLKADIDKESK